MSEGEAKSLSLKGYSRTLSSGSKVFIARIPEKNGGGFALRFTSVESKDTDLFISEEALSTVMSLHCKLEESDTLLTTLRMKVSEAVGALSYEWHQVNPEPTDTTSNPCAEKP